MESCEPASGVFEFNTRIRYSEIDHTGHLKLPALIDAFQDCTTFQSDERGVGMTRLKQSQHAWVLTHWHIVIDRLPAYRDDVTVGTFATTFRGLTATRCFYLRDVEGELIARANSTWAFMDLAAGKPCRPTAEHIARYPTHEPLDLPAEARRVALPEVTEPARPVVVRRHHIDTNEHMNNAQYVAVALDVLPEEITPHQLRVDYQRSAVLGDVIYPAIAREADRTVVVLGTEDGARYAVVEFS